MDDLADAVSSAIAKGDWPAVKLMLHPYLFWVSENGEVVRGRSKVIAMLGATGTPRRPASIELRDGQVYRWVAATDP